MENLFEDLSSSSEESISFNIEIIDSNNNSQKNVINGKNNDDIINTINNYIITSLDKNRNNTKSTPSIRRSERYIFQNKDIFIFWIKYLQNTYSVIFKYVKQNLTKYTYNSLEQMIHFRHLLDEITTTISDLLINAIIMHNAEFIIRNSELNRLIYKHIEVINYFYDFFKLREYNLTYDYFKEEKTYKNYSKCITKDIKFEDLNSKYLNDMINVINSL
jgi:hypothetical protein